MATYAYFYLDNNNTQQGPVEAAQLAGLGVTAATSVWRSGLSDWVKAGTLPELDGFLAPEAAQCPPPPPGAAGTTHDGWHGATFKENAAPHAAPPCPPTYTVWAVLATVLCCLPFGIVAIVKGNNVTSLYTQGKYDLALMASDEAKKWTIVAFVLGIVTCFIGGGLSLLGCLGSLA